MSSKYFVANSFNTNPKRYGVDDGDLNMVNDYFTQRGWDTLTREQFSAIASLIRTRNKFLQDNPNYDLRKKHVPPMFVQLSIYDYLDDDTATQTKKLAHYFIGGDDRLNQSNSRIKKSVRGVDNEHIIAAKVMLPLFVSVPELKKQRRHRKAPNDSGLGNVLSDNLETNLSDREAGE